VKLAPRRVLRAGPDTVLRPVVALDIDGTMALYHSWFLWFAELYVGRDMPPVHAYDGSVPLHRFMGVSKERYRQIKLAYRQGGLKRSMPAYDGAAELTRDVRAAGAEVWVCTTRPYLRLDNIDPDTRHWLRRNRIQYDGVLFGEKKYADLKALVGSGRVVAVLDDLPEQVTTARALGLPAWLVERAHNRGTGLPSLSGLAAARTTVLGRITEWKVSHDVR
jgi:phosphoglycolate phosphatase-like HAD superfamily hydrolase